MTQNTRENEIEVIAQDNGLTLVNLWNDDIFSFRYNEDFITYRDPFGNIMQNKFGTITINNAEYKLTNIGESIIINDGTSITLLSSKDIKELAEKTYFEVDQIPIFDFINLSFKKNY